MKDFPNIEVKVLEDAIELLRYITKERPQDVKDFDNLQNRFMSGRKVGKIPSGAAATSEDRIGDISYDANYYYYVVDNAGTAEWRRIAVTPW